MSPARHSNLRAEEEQVSAACRRLYRQKCRPSSGHCCERTTAISPARRACMKRAAARRAQARNAHAECNGTSALFGSLAYVRGPRACVHFALPHCTARCAGRCLCTCTHARRPKRHTHAHAHCTCRVQQHRGPFCRLPRIGKGPTGRLVPRRAHLHRPCGNAAFGAVLAASLCWLRGDTTKPSPTSTAAPAARLGGLSGPLAALHG